MKQTFVKAAVLACCMAAVGCKQAPMTMGPGEYAVMTIATTDREILSNYFGDDPRPSGHRNLSGQVSGTIFQLWRQRRRKSPRDRPSLSTRCPTKQPCKPQKPTSPSAEASVATSIDLRQQEGAFRPQRRFAVRPANFPEQPADGKIPAGTGRGTASMPPTTSPIRK